MRKNLQIITLLNNFSTGVIVPVLALAILAHGADIRNVSLVTGIYSLTVIVSEFPTGVFADLYGRKRSFLISTVFRLVSYGLMLVSHTLPMILLAMVFNGLGRAFSSGSLDALAIDEAADDAALVKVTVRLNILESAGLAGGALAGGALAGIGTAYEGNILLLALLTVVLFFLTLFSVREPARDRSTHGKEARLRGHLRASFAFVGRRGTVRMLFLFAVLTGFAMLAVETYWQPALTSLSPAAWLLGAVSFAGFVAVMLGNKLTERRLTRTPKTGVALLLIQKAVMGVCLALLMASGHTLAFIGSYVAVYLFLGGASAAENTLLNREAPARQRASILSLFSFVLQAGGLVASLCGYIVSAYTDFRVMWLLAGGMLLLASAVFALLRAAGRRRAGAGAIAE